MSTDFGRSRAVKVWPYGPCHFQWRGFAVTLKICFQVVPPEHSQMLRNRDTSSGLFAPAWKSNISEASDRLQQLTEKSGVGFLICRLVNDHARTR